MNQQTHGVEASIIYTEDTMSGISIGDSFKIYSDFIETPFYFFKSRTIPEISITNLSETINSRNYNFIGSYNQYENVPIQYYIFNLYNEDLELLDTTDKVYSANITYNFDGFTNGEVYYIELVCSNQDNVEVSTGKKQFKADYTEPNVDVTLDYQVLEDKDAIRVILKPDKTSVPNFDGEYSIESNFPFEGTNSAYIEKGNVVYDNVSEEPLEIDKDSYTVFMSTRLNNGFDGKIVELSNNEESRCVELNDYSFYDTIRTSDSVEETVEGRNVEIDGKSGGKIELLKLKGETKQKTRSGSNLLKDNFAMTGEGTTSPTVTTLTGQSTPKGLGIVRKITIPANNDNTFYSGCRAVTPSVVISSINNTNTISARIWIKTSMIFNTDYKIFCTGGFGTQLFVANISLDVGDWKCFELDSYTYESSGSKNEFICVYMASTSESEREILVAEAQINDGALQGWEQYGASPSPDYPSEIENVEGKNKFDINQEKEIFGIMLYKYSYYLKPNTKYTISSNCPASTTANIYANSNSSNSAVYINKNQTIQSDENGYFYILVRFKADASDNSTFNLYEKVLNGTYYIQIEEGTVAKPYVPYNSLEFKVTNGLEETDENYQEQVVTFPLGEEKLMEGSYLADDGIHHKRKQVVFDGSDDENWQIEGTNNFYSNIVIQNSKSSSLVLCNYQKSINKGLGESENCFIGTSKKFNFQSDTINHTVADFKTWLSTHPVIVEYELAEEEIVPYTEAQQEDWDNLQNIASFEGKNYIITDPYGIYIKIEYSFGVTKEKIYDIYSSTKFALQSEQESDVGYIWNDSSVWDNTKYWWFPKENLDSKQFKITILPTSSSILEVE